MMHAGRIETSARLQATLAALRDGPKTTWELSQAIRSCAVHSDVAGLRANGIGVRAEPMPRVGVGHRVYRYVLEAT